jgi:glycogen operon protein
MNSYWEPLQMRLPHLPSEYRWKVVANTYLPYSDETDYNAETKSDGNVIHIPERTTIVLVAEQVQKNQ